MVASSVVTTILVLNYHHRAADTHEMPEWVEIVCPNNKKIYFVDVGAVIISPVAPLAAADVATRDGSQSEVHHDAAETQGIVIIIIIPIIVMLKEVEEKDRVSKTMLITNVLCVEDSFLVKSPHHSHDLPLFPNGFHLER